jgi:serine phosphatase RsbU (regulator of sigma subunit)
MISFVTSLFQLKREISYRDDLISAISNLVEVTNIQKLPNTVSFILRQDKTSKIILYKHTKFTQLNFSNVNIHQEVIGKNTVRYLYFNINDPKTFSILNLFSKDDIHYTVGFSYVSLRANISDYVTYFILLMFLSYVLILLAVPYFYRISIQKRLTALLDGVKQVNQGNYHIKIAVPIEDEIGFLAKSFNGMVLAIRRSTVEHEKLISIKQELQLAKKIQMATLPDKIPVIDGLSIYAKYIPMGDIGGDFYDFHKINDSRVCVFIADVSGHGIPAAMGASMVKLVFSQQYSNFKDPAKLLNGMNESLFLRLNHSFVTAAYLFIDTHKGIIKYSNAGHPAFIINKREKKTIEEIFVKGPCIGFKSNASFHNLEVKVYKGDRVILYTDGITECMNPAKELFGEERFKAFINQNTSSTPAVLVSRLDIHLKEWKQSHGKFEDDFTIIVLDID